MRLLAMRSATIAWDRVASPGTWCSPCLCSKHESDANCLSLKIARGNDVRELLEVSN